MTEETKRRRKRKTPHEKGMVRRSSNKWLQLVTIVLRAPTKPFCRTARPPNPRGFSHTQSRCHMCMFVHVWHVCARCHAARNIDKHDTKVGHEQAIGTPLPFSRNNHRLFPFRSSFYSLLLSLHPTGIVTCARFIDNNYRSIDVCVCKAAIYFLPILFSSFLATSS